MRLGQLARHLNLSPSELKHYLETNGHSCESGTNTKLDEFSIRLVLSKFAPERLTEVGVLVEQEDQPESGESDKDTDVKSELNGGAAVDPASAETIRAPKVELPGLKVVGKIDLPEPRKKQPDRAPEPSAEEREDRFKPKRTRDSERRTWINPLERQRQREAREAEERKKKQIELDKEKRTAAYRSRQEKMKQIQPKKKSSQSESKPNFTPRLPKSKPNSFLGKFWYWLTHAE